MWDLAGPAIEWVSPALQGGFFFLIFNFILFFLQGGFLPTGSLGMPPLIFKNKLFPLYT